MEVRGSFGRAMQPRSLHLVAISGSFLVQRVTTPQRLRSIEPATPTSAVGSEPADGELSRQRRIGAEGQGFDSGGKASQLDLRCPYHENFSEGS